MSGISKKTSYRIWGWSSFFIFVTSLVMLFVVDDISYSLITIAAVSFISLFVWLICWADKDWSDTKVYSGKLYSGYNIGLLDNKKSGNSSGTLTNDNSTSKKESSVFENLAELYIIDQIFGGGLFGKK